MNENFLGIGQWAGTIVIISLVTVLLYAFFLPPVIIRLPANYFLPRQTRGSRKRWHQQGPWWWMRKIIKNLLGIVLIALGIVLLVLPGQGLLTILVGVLLCDFPGKRAFLRWFVLRTKLASMLNRYRIRHKHPPFLF